MSIPLEDNGTDIVGKAQRGLGISATELAERGGISLEDARELSEGSPSEKAIRAAAPVLHLGTDALVAAFAKSWEPQPSELEHLAAFTTPFEDMTVNSYLIWEPQTREAAAFDTGADCSGMLEYIHDQKLNLQLIFLTHTHGDHIFDLDRLKSKTGAPAWVNEREPIAGAETFATGAAFDFGSLKIGTRLTCGHSRGGTTYVIDGLERPVAIVGDAIFAGSMGGGMISYADALRTNREQILTLPDHTIICPGHGPMTTVGEEKKHNPFLANV